MSYDTSGRRGRSDYIRDRYVKELSRASKDRLQDVCDQTARAIAADAYDTVAAALGLVLLPAADLSFRDFCRLERAIDTTEQEWYRGALRLVLLKQRESESDTETAAELERLDGRTLEHAFESVKTVLAEQDLIDNDATHTVPVWEYEHKVAERHYAPLSSGDDELNLADEDSEMMTTLLTGGTGSGKSTSGFTLVEDRLARGHKVIDLVDTSKAENVLYDCENRHSTFDTIRREAGVDVGFESFDPPDQEILMPLTERMEDAKVPFDVESDESPVTVFTIPASELSYRQLVMLLPHSTKTHENYLHAAYSKVTRRFDDYTLADIADIVRTETNAGEMVANRIERALESVQQKGFVRDKQCPHALDWESMMADADTASSFSVWPAREDITKKAILSHLVDSLREARDQLHFEHRLKEFPPLTIVMRELHFVVPSSLQKSEQNTESSLESYMVDSMQSIMALHRHANAEIIGDAQKFKAQLDSSVSTMFHRIFAFSGQRPDIKEVFKTKVGDTAPAEKVANWEDPGKCALVSKGYRMPIQFLPPRHHHLDAKREGNGLAWRARNLEDEELRQSPWDAAVPPRLRFDSVTDGPMERFVYEQTAHTGVKEDAIPKREFLEAYNEWALENGRTEKSASEVGRWIKEHTEFGERRLTIDGDRVRCWTGVVLSDR